MYFEVIQKFYGFLEIHFESCNHIFISGRDCYYISSFRSKKEALACVDLSFLVLNSYKPVYNCNHCYITEYDGCFFILFLIRRYKFYVSFLFKPLIVLNNIHLEWRKDWILKSDYICSFYSSIKGEYPLVDESIHYYLSLLDFSIYLLKDYDDYYDYGCLQHNRFLLDEYFNPIFFKIDVKERDFANYLKYLFFSGTYEKIDIFKLISAGRNQFNYDLVLIRLLFPDYYFDLFDEIVLEKVNCSLLCSVIDKQNFYMTYIQKIYNEIEKVYPIKKDIKIIS